MKDRRAYVFITVDLPANKKLVGEDARAKWLHACGIIASGRDLTDGHVRARVICAEADVPDRFAKRLLEVGVWHPEGHDCSKCPQPKPGHVYIHDYLEHQRSKAEADEMKRRRRVGAALTNHKRWHDEQPDPDCHWCRSSDRSTDRSSESLNGRSTDRSAVAVPIAELRGVSYG